MSGQQAIGEVVNGGNVMQWSVSDAVNPTTNTNMCCWLRFSECVWCGGTVDAVAVAVVLFAIGTGRFRYQIANNFGKGSNKDRKMGEIVLYIMNIIVTALRLCIPDY